VVERTMIQIPGVGTFGIPPAAMEQASGTLAALGYEGETNTGAQASQWGGNPFGDRVAPSRRLQLEAALEPCVRSLPLAATSVNKSNLSSSNESARDELYVDQTTTPDPCEEANETIAATVSESESNVVSMGLSSSQGEASEVGELRDPILIWLASSGRQYGKFAGQMRDGLVPQCLFWDPVKMDWAGDGCKVLDVRNGGLRCCVRVLTLRPSEPSLKRLRILCQVQTSMF